MNPPFFVAEFPTYESSTVSISNNGICEIPNCFLPPVEFPTYELPTEINTIYRGLDNGAQSNSSNSQEFSYIKTSRGKSAIIHHNYLYFQKKVYSSGKIYYNCREPNCKGTLTISGEVIFSQKDNHNHQPDKTKINELKMLNEVKETASTTTMSTKEILTQHRMAVAEGKRRARL
ncbi:hypothetical protein SNEBB_004295 [Seison nebaliae]|nr:hypothetical protein SNEBB_004295 [Seison nebaliae]